MPTRYEDDEDRIDTGGGDREISLGTGTILGIFLALALVCSLFFGLGYSMGRKSSPATTSAATPSRASTSSPETNENVSEKPSSASPASRLASSPARPDLQVTQPTEQGQQITDAASPGMSAVPTAKTSSHDRQQTVKPPAIVPAEPVTPADITASGPQVFVQIAAVSRKEDADLLLSALRRRGYAGLIRPQSQDKLLHVQVGPFPAKKDAEAMRQRLITDGYNPILK